jgi:dCMP deaminase
MNQKLESMKRISKLNQLMMHAEVASLRSHDTETKVGCVLVDDKDTITGTGYNGFVRGAQDHNLPNTRPNKYNYMVHSEINLIASCAREGKKMDKHYVVCTHSPCVTCMRALYQCGVNKVIVKQKYRDFEDLKNMLDLHISEKVTEEGYIELTYTPK